MTDSVKRIQTLKRMVEEVLQDIPETRDSDIRLTIEIWKRFYPQRILMSATNREMVALDSLYDLPREDNVKRIRAKFQNDPEMPLYPPTKLEIALERGFNEETWKKALGYATNVLDLR